MVNKAAKGTRIELKAIKIMESMGYTVHRCVRTHVKRGGMFISQSNDVFGCIDLIGKKHGHPTLWVQVTTKTVSIGSKMKDLHEVPWDDLHDKVEIWQYWGAKDNKEGTGEFFQVRDYFDQDDNGNARLIKDDDHRYYVKDYV